MLLCGLLAVVMAGCGAPPTPSTGSVQATAAPATSSPAAAAALTVRHSGKIGCAAFPYGCFATMSVLEPGTVVADAWRPPATDPRWIPDASTTDLFDPTPAGMVPALTVGRHLLVVSLLGTYDVPSYGPDGSRAFDLLSRCSAEVEVLPSAAPIEVVVTFVPDGVSFGGTCTLDVSDVS